MNGNETTKTTKPIEVKDGLIGHDVDDGSYYVWDGSRWVNVLKYDDAIILSCMFSSSEEFEIIPVKVVG